MVPCICRWKVARERNKKLCMCSSGLIWLFVQIIISLCICFIFTGPWPICSIDKAMICMYIEESENDYLSEAILKLEIRLDGSILLPITHIYANELGHNWLRGHIGSILNADFITNTSMNQLIPNGYLQLNNTCQRHSFCSYIYVSSVNSAKSTQFSINDPFVTNWFKHHHLIVTIYMYVPMTYIFSRFAERNKLRWNMQMLPKM